MKSFLVAVLVAFGLVAETEASSRTVLLQTCYPQQRIAGAPQFDVLHTMRAARGGRFDFWYTLRLRATSRTPQTDFKLVGQGITISDSEFSEGKIDIVINRGRSGSGRIHLRPVRSQSTLVLRGLQVETNRGPQFWDTGLFSYRCSKVSE